MQPRLIAHVDMDCFYAACEIKKTPSLAGRALIIGANPRSPRGVVCTASYEARKFGVRSALPISQAVRLCPPGDGTAGTGIYLRPDFSCYSKASKEIMTILQNLEGVSAFEQISIDEANLDITDLACQVERFPKLIDVGKYIRKLIHEQTGYSCSVGIAQSKRVAKIAAGYKKPHGVTTIYNMKSFLAPMPIDAIPGIGKKSVPYFHNLGIKTIADLANKDRFFVLEKLGHGGFEYWLLANGLDFTAITQRGEDKSYSREETYMEDLTNPQAIEQNLKDLAAETYEDIEKSGCMYRTVTIKVRYSGFVTITRSISFPFTTSAKDSLIKAVEKLGKTEIDFTRPIRLLGVRVSNLIHSSAHQTSLFDFSQRSDLGDSTSESNSILLADSLQLQNEEAPKIM